jgi:hypothetical protein
MGEGVEYDDTTLEDLETDQDQNPSQLTNSNAHYLLIVGVMKKYDFVIGFVTWRVLTAFL